VLNRIAINGRLVTDPELTYSPAGVAICKLRIACDRDFRVDGQPTADSLNVVCFKKTAEAVANNVQKGRLVSVDGRLQVRQYQTQDGQKREAVEILADNIGFLDKPKGE
jgi:single-strand DNA-binding protein